MTTSTEITNFGQKYNGIAPFLFHTDALHKGMQPITESVEIKCLI